MAAEDTAVGVDLVEHDVAQVREEGRPAGVVGQDAGVQHVGIGNHQASLTPDGWPRAPGRIAVVGRRVQFRRQGLIPDRQLSQLILGQGLGGEEVEGAGVWIGQQGLQDRQVVAQCLARGSGRDDCNVPARQRGLHCLGLVGVETAQAPRLARRHQACIEPRRPRPVARRLGLQPAPGGDVEGEAPVLV